MQLRKLYYCLLGATLAATALASGCRGHRDHEDRNDQPAPVAAQPAQPAPAPTVVNETVIYNKWEAETHRAHVDLDKRKAEEQKEYREWRAKQERR